MIFYWRKNKDQVVLIVICIIIIGLFFSRSAISIGTGFLGFIGIISISKEKIKSILNVQYLVFIFTYTLFLISIHNTTDLSTYQKLIFLELPLIIFPLFFSQCTLAKRQVYAVLRFYVVLTSLICFGTIIEFLSNYQFYNQEITNSKSIVSVTGVMHYQFALLIVIAIVCCSILMNHYKNKLWFGLMLFLIVTIHVLAYRTALFCFYFLLIIYLIKQLSNKKHIKIKLVATFTSLTLIVLSSIFVKPLNLKIKNTYQDISRIINHENFNNYSIAQRYAATLNSIEIIKKNPWFGIAPADVGLEMKAQYEIDSYLLIPENRIEIHNQYLFYLMSFGIVTFVIWFFLWIYNIVKNYRDRNAGFYILIIASLVFLIDNFFQIQIGFTSILLFYYLLCNLQTSNKLENRYI
jgi:O-antigen ligase